LKILLLNQTFYPDVASTAQHLADLAVELAARGHEVSVVTSRHAYDDPKERFAGNQTWRGVRIMRVGSTAFGKNANWRRALDCASFILLCGLRVARLPRQDVVVTLTSPPLISLLGLWLARSRRSRFVYWVMDLNPDEAVAAGCLQGRSIVTTVLEWISRSSLRRADEVIALDRFMFERIVAKGIAPTCISILPPWSHDSEVRFDPVGREHFRKTHGLDGKFVVMYSGNHGPCHPLGTVLQAAQRLTNNHEIAFCFIGGGTEFRKIQRVLTKSNLSRTPTDSGGCLRNVWCLPYQPLGQLSASLSAADLHVVTMGNAFVGLVHPCKIYNILRVGSPLVYIGPMPSPAAEILSEANGQLVSASLRHGDVDGLVRQIQRVRSVSPAVVRATDLALCARFSKATTLPRLIAKLEDGKDAPQSRQ
jgi:colanic acid biosynthesis glycosyl transferase WcaI